MPLKKRKPGLIVVKARQRLMGMKKIDNSYKTIIDYGGPNNPLSSKEFDFQIKNCIEYNKIYNEALKNADEKSASLKAEELKLSDMYSRVLSGCLSKFGNDAVEVALLGGTRKSDRKKSNKTKIN